MIMTKRTLLAHSIFALGNALGMIFISLVGAITLHAQVEKTYPSLNLIPQENRDYAQGVSGHFGFFASTDWLVIGGGCNFPDIPVAQGGKKRYYAEVYAQYRPEMAEGFTTPSNIGRWTLCATLPSPLAYPHAVEEPGTLYLYGGETPQGDSDLIQTLQYDLKLERLNTTTSSLRLPTTRAAGATVRYERKPQASQTSKKLQTSTTEHYLIGGRKAGKLTNSMLRIRLLPSGRLQIDEMPPYPGAPLLKVVAWQSQGYIYLLGSVAGSEQDFPSATLSLSGYRYDIEREQWIPLPLPASGFNGATFGGGSVLDIEGRPLLVGGVHAEVFLPAIQRSQAMRRASSSLDSTALTRLQADNRTYLEMPVDAFRFNDRPWSFNPSTGSWRSGQAQQALAVADALILKRWSKPLQSYIIYVIAGELKAGIRTPRIFSTPLDSLWSQ